MDAVRQIENTLINKGDKIMTTVNIKDYVEENANKGNEAAKEVMEKVNKNIENAAGKIVPIISKKDRSTEEVAADIGELKGILAAAIASGLKKVIVKIPVRLLAIDTAYQTPARTERDLRPLVSKWDDVKCMPLLGVPHLEVGYMVIMDGFGRTVASQMLEEKYEKLDVTVVLDAPTEFIARRKFEAEQFLYQNDGAKPVNSAEKHGALTTLEDPTALCFNELQAKYQFKYVKKPGKRQKEMLGSYDTTMKIIHDNGKACMEYILDICKEIRYNQVTNGYSVFIFTALCDAWVLYAEDRTRTKLFLEETLRKTTPSMLRKEALGIYKYHDTRMAVSLYIEDLLVKNLHLQQSRTIENGRVVPVRKFA